MKKLLLILVALLCTVSVYTQTEKGRMFIGGNLSIYASSRTLNDTLTNDKYSNFEVQIMPGFGYFLKNNFAIGGNLNFGINNSTQKVDYPNQTPSKRTVKNNSLNLGADVYVQYYKKIVPNFFVFIRGSLGFNYEAQKREDSNNDPDYVYPYYYPAVQHIHINDISIAVSPGLVYFITPKLGIQASFGNIYYRYSMSKNTTFTYEHSNSSTFGLNVNPSSFYFGLNYYFK